MSPARVTSRTGVVNSPSSMRMPLIPTENSPETGLAPEWIPTASVTRTPFSTPATISSSGVVGPATTRLLGLTRGRPE
ncbi:MAG: hypothetical protein BWY94_02354 [Actinobacteria bacterium ADurb.BinA094]|nr:MAG: hypothetical protein BWY94_02354 [Actinobacteria bacterium ADurb.BinA094]